ncbi:MAG: hypothetical protein ACREQL_11310 [Candidatus Binatia bacterium]
MLARARRAGAAYFYADESPVNLGVARIAVFVALAWSMDVTTLVHPTLLPPALIRAPIGMTWLQPLVPACPESALALLWVVRVSAWCAAFGVLTRVSMAVAALGSVFLLVIPSMYGHVAHVRHHLVWFSSLLALSRCGDALSVDAWWRRVRGREPPLLAPAPCYGFPLRAMAVVLGVFYLFAGVAKLAAGPDWVLSDNLEHLAAKQAFSANGVEPVVGHQPIGAVAAGPWWEYLTSRRVLEPSPWLARAGGVFTLVFEVGFVFAVLTSTGRLAAAFAGVVFHNFTRVFVGIGFDELLLCYPLLVDVDGWARWLGRRLGRIGPARDGVEGTDGRRMPPSTPLVAMATFLILGNTTFGLLRIGNGWPLTCAPRFDVVHSALYTSYVVSGVRPDGTEIHVRDGGLGGPVFGRRLRHVFRARQSNPPGLEEPGDRLVRWHILCAVVWNHHPRLADASDVRFSLVDVDLAHGADHPRVLAERELFHCNRADEAKTDLGGHGTTVYAGTHVRSGTVGASVPVVEALACLARDGDDVAKCATHDALSLRCRDRPRRSRPGDADGGRGLELEPRRIRTCTVAAGLPRSSSVRPVQLSELPVHGASRPLSGVPRALRSSAL